MAYCSHCAAVLTTNQTECARCGRAVPFVANERPASVSVAVTLLLISCGISFLSMAGVAVSLASARRFLLPSAGFLILWIVFAILLWQRQGWARIAIVLLLAWGVSNLALTFVRISGWTLAIPIGVAALRLCAAYFMFRPDSNTWFKIH